MNQWQNANDDIVKELPYHIAEWLLEFGSLTEKLERNINSKVHLEVLKEEYSLANLEESQLLGVAEASKLWSREVLLFGINKPWIYAKTLVPSSNASLIESLGSKPLGGILFSEKQLSRQFLKVRQLEEKHHLHQSAQLYTETTKQKLWARRSLWQNPNYKDMKLLVSEIFLPGSPLYKK